MQTELYLRSNVEHRKSWGLFNSHGTLVEVKLMSVKPKFSNFELSRNWLIGKAESLRYQIEEIVVASVDGKKLI